MYLSTVRNSSVTGLKYSHLEIKGQLKMLYLKVSWKIVFVVVFFKIFFSSGSFLEHVLVAA